jgi:hypothetical protein
MKPKQALIIVTISIWFLTATLAIFGLSAANKSDFDPEMKLSEAIMSLSFEQELADVLYALPTSSDEISELQTSTLVQQRSAPAIYHIRQGKCFCEYLANKHKTSLQLWSQQTKFVNVNVDLTQHPELVRFVPSTPSVIAVDENGMLVYLGPYSRGLGCFANSGQVDNYLADWVNKESQTDRVNSRVIDTEASGCYCAT